MTAARRWIIGGAIGLVLLLVAGWFLLISPKQSEAADLRDQTVNQLAANDQTRLRIARLRAQAAELPAQRALLASIQRQLPNTPALPTLIRDLTAAARAGNVRLVSLAPATPVAMQLMEPTPQAPSGETGDTGAGAATGEPDTGTGDTATPTPAPTAAAPTDALFRIEVAMTVEGSYFDVQRFISRTEVLDRTMLVTGFTLTPGGQGDTAATAVRRSPDLTAVLTGQVFVSPTLGVVNPGTVTPSAPPTTGSTQAAAAAGTSVGGR
jgi:Tfp pilus assembly protein PilO